MPTPAFGEEEEEENVIYLGDKKPVILKPNQNSRSRGNSESKNKKPKEQKGNKIINVVYKFVQYKIY